MSAQGEEPVVVRILRAEAMDDTRLCDEQGLLICGVIDDATHYVEARDVIEAYDAAIARAKAAEKNSAEMAEIASVYEQGYSHSLSTIEQHENTIARLTRELAAAREVFRALPIMRCEWLHHPKRERHATGVECALADRLNDALLRGSMEAIHAARTAREGGADA